MTREEVERVCEQISEWTKFSSRPIHHTVLRLLDHDAEQRKKIADQAMEITTINLALLDRDREIEQLSEEIAKLRDTRDSLATQLNEYVQEVAQKEEKIHKLRLDLEHFEQLQADLDRVMGEAVRFAQIVHDSGYTMAQIITMEDEDDAARFLDSPIVQSWRTRQGKEGV